MAFNEETQKFYLEVNVMKKRNGLTYVWKKNGAWIDANWFKLQKLCDEEAVDAGIERPYASAEIFDTHCNEVIFRVRTNSQYVFQYIMMQTIKKDIKRK